MKIKTRHIMRKHILIFKIIFVLMVLMVGNCFSADHGNADKEAMKEKLVGGKASFTEDGFFYVYDDGGSRLNHEVPSGWMGDYGDIALDLNWEENPQSGTTCMKWTYTAEGKQGEGWGGAYWQTPQGYYIPDREVRFDLSKAKRLIVWARGEKGNEKILIKVGGLGGELSDSDTKTSEVLILSKDWQEFIIDLSDMDLSYIGGIFCWIAEKQSNPDGCIFYLDNVRYEK